MPPEPETAQKQDEQTAGTRSAPGDASADRLRTWTHSAQAKDEPEDLDDFAIIERIVPQTKPRGILGISFGSIKIEESDTAALPMPEARQSQEAPPAAPKKARFSLFRKSPAPENDGDQDSGDSEAYEEARLERAARKQARKEEKESERARKKAEKQARKDAKRAAAEAEAEAAAEAAESNADDLPGPPPESLRRPYPELRKPISVKPKRSRPEPFPELRKPPGERRPPPEPFPELRKPALERPRPEPYPELRRPERDPEDDRQAERARQEPPADTASPQEGGSESEPKRTGGWLSDVLKSAERFEAQTPAMPFSLEDEEQDETAPAKDEATPPPYPDEPLSQDGPSAEEEAAAAMEEPEAAAPGEQVEDRSVVDDEYRRRADEALAQAALLDEHAPIAAEASSFETSVPEEDDTAVSTGGPEAVDHGLPDDAAHETAEVRERMDAALQEDAAGTQADEIRELTSETSKRERRRTSRRRAPPGQLELGLPSDAAEEPEAWEQPETVPPEPGAFETGDTQATPEWTAAEEPVDPESEEYVSPPLTAQDGEPYGEDIGEDVSPPLTAQDSELYVEDIGEDVSPPLTAQDGEPYGEDIGEPEEAEELDAYGGHWDAAEEAGTAPSSWQEEPYTDLPEANAGEMAEPGEPYAHERADETDYPDLAESEAPAEPQGDAEEQIDSESSVLPRYADLLDPTYRPRHGFMDLGRRSILFPDDETGAEGEPADGVWDDSTGEPLGSEAHSDAEAEQWPAYTEYSGALEGSSEHGIVDVRNGGNRMERGARSLRAAPVEHPLHAEEVATQEPSAWHDFRSGDSEDDVGEEDEAPVFVPPEPSGRPEEAAALMRTIAHTDTEYYLPPSKTPGMVLLGLAGAALGAFLAHALYGMLGDVIVPRFMVILIGVQIFGGAGVMLGTTFTMSLGRGKRKGRAIRLHSDEWVDDGWDEIYEDSDRDPLPPEPHFDVPAASPERQDPRAAMRPSAHE